MKDDDSSFGKRYFDAFVGRVDATFYLPKIERKFDSDVDSILRPGWYLPYAVTRIIQPYRYTGLQNTFAPPCDECNGTHDCIFNMSQELVLIDPFDPSYKPKAAMPPTYVNADGKEDVIPIQFAAHLMSRLSARGVLQAQNDAYFGMLNAACVEDSVVDDAPGASFVILNELLRLFEDHTYRYVEEHLPRQQRRASGMPAKALHFRVVPRGERTLYKREELQTIAQIKRRMHAVRGFERTYKADRYIHMKGQKQFIKPHIRGTLGTAVQIPDYRVES